MSGIIDIVVNLYTPTEVDLGQTGLDDEFKEQVRMPEEMRPGVTIPDYIKKMGIAFNYSKPKALIAKSHFNSCEELATNSGLCLPLESDEPNLTLTALIASILFCPR